MDMEYFVVAVEGGLETFLEYQVRTTRLSDYSDIRK